MHDIKPASDPASRTHHLNVAATCGACHGPQGARTGAPSVAAHFDDSIHGRALRKQGLVVAPNCASCHGPHEIRKKTDPASTVHRAQRRRHVHEVPRGDPAAPTSRACTRRR